MLSCQVGALHIPCHTHIATSPPWHERTLVSAHPTGSTHPRITALLTLFLLSPNPRGLPVSDTAQLLFPSLAVAGLSQPPCLFRKPGLLFSSFLNCLFLPSVFHSFQPH